MRYLLALVVVAGCGDNLSVTDDAAAPPPVPVFAQTAYIKSSQPMHDAHFGTFALSGDGNTLVAAQLDTVTVYTRDTAWRVVGELVPTGASIGFGSSVAISSDGSTIAVGASDDHRAYVYRKVDGAWMLDARIDGTEQFAISIALSSDGNLLVVGSRNTATEAGRIRTYEREASGWSLVDTIGGGTDDFAFGFQLALSPDGSMLAARVFRRGAMDYTVDVFGRSGDAWLRHTTLTSPEQGPVEFGSSISCSARCETLALGTIEPGVMPGQEGAVGTGVTYLFTGDGATWTPTGTLTASNGEIGDRFGTAVAISVDGSTIVVGAPSEGSASTGINGDGANNNALYAGAAYVFRLFHGAWWQVMYLKASNAETTDIFGSTVGVSSDGTTIALGALYEAGGSTGVDGDQTDNSMPYAGAIYAFAGTY